MNFDLSSNRIIGHRENYGIYEQHSLSHNCTPKQSTSQANLNFFSQQKQPTENTRGVRRHLSYKGKTFQGSTTPRNFQNSEPNYESSTDVTLSSIATESNVMASNNMIEHLDVLNFKVRPCSLNTQHNHKQCPYYHNSKDRKRPEGGYTADLCEYAENPENCPKGDNCNRAHNRVEQLYKQEKYKTKFCGHYPHNLHLCEYGTFCSFAHNEHDISIELIHNYEYDDDFYMFHFKTVWCPFNLSQHDKALCVYAHNWQDYRRKPNVCSYDPIACPNWKPTDFIVNYEDGCPLKEKCTKCHGWKELEYHPLNYKTKHCPSKNCIKGKDCPHYHNIKEKRSITMNVSNRVFKLMPKNRIITGTFKKRKDEGSGSNKSNGSFSNEESIPMDNPPMFPPGFERVQSLPSQEQLKWMNNMIQNMMQMQCGHEDLTRELEVKEMGGHKRRNSVDSPYFGDKKRPEPVHSTTNNHVHSLFGGKQQHVQTQKFNDLAPSDMMFRAILESPMKLFTNTRSLQELDPRPRCLDTSLQSPGGEELDSAVRSNLERLISAEDF